MAMSTLPPDWTMSNSYKEPDGKTCKDCQRQFGTAVLFYIVSKAMTEKVCIVSLFAKDAI